MARSFVVKQHCSFQQKSHTIPDSIDSRQYSTVLVVDDVVIGQWGLAICYYTVVYDRRTNEFIRHRLLFATRFVDHVELIPPTLSSQLLRVPSHPPGI